MRNGTFLGVVAAVVAGGLVVGWYGERVLAKVASGGAGSVADQARPKPPRWVYTLDTTQGASSDEDIFARRTGRAPAHQPKPGGCVIPSAGPDAKVVMFGVYESQAISSVAVGSQGGQTGVIDVEIEPGGEPLYIVLASYDPMVWRIRGATDRVAKLALTSHSRRPNGMPDVAVSGVPADRVAAIHGRACPDYFHAPGSSQAQRLADALHRSIGRLPSVTAGRYDISAVRLPSGMGAVMDNLPSPPPPPGFDPRTWREALRFSPGGVVRLDPAELTGPAPREPYEVLPEQAGLAQLVGSGALERRGDTFVIKRAIPRYPAGLAGAHSVRFEIAEGVSRPSGTPGHSCVGDEGPHC